MKKVVGVLVVLGLIALGIYAYLSTPVATVQPPGLEPAPASLEIPGSAVEATVDYVHDGDTLFLTDGTKVRLLAVDTPEVGDNLECLGNESRDYLRALLPKGSTIYTQADAEPTDQYGRSLLFIWTASGTLVNLDLVEQGYAEAVFIGANRLYEDQVEAAEDSAQDAGRGIWGAC